ncbi:hypothetical protein QZH41_019260, partial [Actinostola sp. cb2023]
LFKDMGVFRVILDVVSVVLRAVSSFGFLWEVRHQLRALCYGRERCSVDQAKHPELYQSARAVAENIRNGIIKAEDVMLAYVDRIREVNPMLNAIVSDRFEEAIIDAREIDTTLAHGSSEEKEKLRKKSLLGVPITVKESISFRGMPHSSGIVERKHIIADTDSAALNNLREAGAIPIAVTNCSELCMWWETTNNVNGRTNNPHNTNRIAGGSSGGEGAIIASAGSLCGIGSDVGGSIRMPAFFNGIFGHKPSPGIVPNEGHFPCGTTTTFNEYLTIGPMCRYAEDLPLMLEAMALPTIYRLQLHEEIDISSLKVFVLDEFDPVLMSPVDEELSIAQRKVCDFLEKEHQVTVQKANLKLFRYAALIWSSMVFASEDNDLISKFLDENSKPMNPFVELVKSFGGFSKYHFITPLIGCLEKMNYHDNLTSTFVALGNKLRQQLDLLLGNDGILLFPSHPNTAMEHNRPILAPLDFNYTSIFNVLHMPVTQCPLGVDKEGMPLGIQIAATRDNDRLTLAVARQLEKGFGGWEAWQPGVKVRDKSC